MKIFRFFSQVAVWFLMGLLGVLAILTIIVLSLDLTDYRDFISSKIEEHTTWKVNSFTDIEIAWGTAPTLKLKGLNLVQTDMKSAIERVKLENFEIRINLWPIITEDLIQVKKIRLSNSLVELRASELREEIKEEQVAQESLQEALDGFPKIFFESVAVNDFKLRYLQPNGQTILVRLDRLVGGSQSANLPVEFKASGEVQELPFDIGLTVGSFEKLRDDKSEYSITLNAIIGAQKVSLDGQVYLVDERSRKFTFKIKAEGSDIRDVTKTFKIPYMHIPAYDLKTQLSLARNQLKIGDIGFTLGKTYLYGHAQLDFSKKPLYISGNLNSTLVRWQDIESLWKESGTGEALAASEENQEAKPGILFSREPIDLSFLNLLEGKVSVGIGKTEGGPVGGLLDGFRALFTLTQGTLKTEILRIASGQGEITGDITLQVEGPQLMAKTNLGVTQLDISKLIKPAVKESNINDKPAKDLLRGKLVGRIDLETTGKSLHQLASRLSGQVKLGIEDGAATATAVELAGLDVTETLVSWMADHPLTDINCSLAILNAEQGVVRSQTFLIATKDSNIVGEGFLDLENEYIDFTIRSRARDFSILSGQSPVTIKGKLSDIGIEVISDELLVRTTASIIAGIVNPLLGILPFVDLGLEKGGKCDGTYQEIAEMKKITEKMKKEAH